jgi:tetratricopeptide (TPR) repeat protein
MDIHALDQADMDIHALSDMDIHALDRYRIWTSMPSTAAAACSAPFCRMKRLIGCALLMAAPALGAQDFAMPPGADPVRDYLEAIEHAESMGGAYAGELVDLYHGMGHSLIELGELEEARDAFHRAAMVSRVNFGPYSLEQTNYLYSIADIEFRVDNPEAAVEVLKQIYRIHAQHHGEDNPDLLPALEQISGWYTDRLEQSAETIRPSDYQNLSYLAERIAYLTEARYGLGHPQSAMSSRAEAQAHFRAIHKVALTGQSPDPDLVMNSDEVGSQLGPGRVALDHFLAGEAALKRVVQSWQENPNATELDVAEAVAQVGDWNLAFEYYRSAEHNYEQAYRILAASADFASLADRYLGQPTPIRFMNMAESSVRDVDSPAAAGGLNISMTVMVNGRLQDVEIINPQENLSEEQSREILSILESALFRPAVIDGEVRALEGFVWKIPTLSLGVAETGGSG